MNGEIITIRLDSWKDGCYQTGIQATTGICYYKAFKVGDLYPAGRGWKVVTHVHDKLITIEDGVVTDVSAPRVEGEVCFLVAGCTPSWTGNMTFGLYNDALKFAKLYVSYHGRPTVTTIYKLTPPRDTHTPKTNLKIMGCRYECDAYEMMCSYYASNSSRSSHVVAKRSSYDLYKERAPDDSGSDDDSEEESCDDDNSDINDGEEASCDDDTGDLENIVYAFARVRENNKRRCSDNGDEPPAKR